MWGIDPCAGAHRQDGSLGPPRARRACHRHRAASLESTRSAFPSKSSYLRRFIREAASGARLSDSPGAVRVGELELTRQRGRALDPFLMRQMLFCVFDSACLPGLELCHTASSCSGRLGVGDDDCFGLLLGKRLGDLASFQPAGRPRLVWLHSNGVRLHQFG